MGKFVIDSVLIEKSDKDIKTGLKYEFTDAFNVICGNNETGKSSLMAFIKNGFFKNKSMESGKIFFKIPEKNLEYRADINGNKTPKDRCKIYSGDDTNCDYSILKKYIEQKYFEEGFTINLDDLMKIQNNDTSSFVNIIKDPSGEKLNSYLEVINKSISNTITSEGRLKKEVKSILTEIDEINNKINEFSKNEDKYFDSINKIKNIDLKLSKITKQEDFLKNKKELNSIKTKLQKLNEDKAQASLPFNEKLYLNKDKYIDLIQEAGSYSVNLDSINKSIEKIKNIEFKITEEKARLVVECGLELSEEEINNFVIDYEQINKLKEIIEQTEEIKSNIKTNNLKLEDVENNLLKLKCIINEKFNLDNTHSEIKKLEEAISNISEGINQYNYLSNEIGNNVKYDIINANANSRNHKLQVLLAILCCVTVICAVVSFYQHIQTAGIFSILMAILALAGFSSLKLGSYIENQDEEKAKKLEQRKNILNALKDEVKEYFSEIYNFENNLVLTKITEIKNDIQLKVNELKSLVEQYNVQNNDKKYNLERQNDLTEKNAKFNSELDSLNEKVIELVNSNLQNTNISAKKYLDAIEIIKALKNEIENRNITFEEKENAEKINNQILEKVKNFILENNIDLVISENFNETLSELKSVNNKNNIAKQSIDAIEVGIDSLNKQLEKYDVKNIEEFSEFDNLNDFEIDTQIENLKEEKAIKLEEKKNLEFQKRDCEKYEGIADLKTEKGILLSKYKNVIKNLVINKMTLDLVAKAKEDFDKTQPDLINAQKYLSILTDGKYSKINLDMQEIESEDGTSIKKWENLSRGTKEQLYFALRLGYASNYSKDKTTLEPNGKQDLPLIVDDAFVNFDVVRTINALKCLKEFSKTNQVFFFTCHKDETLKQLQELDLKENKNLKVIDL